MVDMPGKKTLFLYYDPHYFHAALADSLGAKYFQTPQIRSSRASLAETVSDAAKTAGYLGKIPKGYDVYLCEGTYLFPTLAKSIGALPRSAKIINITSSPLLYYMKIGRVKGPKRTLGLKMLRSVDGFICVGKMEQSLLRAFYPGARSMVTYPFIKESVRPSLKSAQPALGSKKILCIGSRDVYCKGIDLLIKAFKIARVEIPGLKLTILGDYDSKMASSDKGISFPGYVKDPSKYIRESALYVHLGRGEAFGISIMESMLAGVPAIVSEATGAKELVSKVDGSMVVPLDAKIAAAAMVDYLKSSQRRKSVLSSKSRALASEYTEARVIRRFKADYAKMLDQI